MRFELRVLQGRGYGGCGGLEKIPMSICEL